MISTVGESIVAAPPKGWRRVRLCDLAANDDAFADGPFGSNLKTEHYTDTGARVVQLQNVGRGAFLGNDQAFVSMDHYRTLQRHWVQPGDVVVAALGDGARPAGRACIIPDNFGPGLVKADCFRVRLPPGVVYAPYLVAFLNSPQVLARVAETMRGVTRPRVTLSMLKGTAMPLPPLPEQERIATILEGQLAAVERSRKALKDQLNAIDALPGALLRRAFNGEL